MPKVLTTNAVITCPHGGIGTTTATTPLVDAGGTVTSEGDTGTLTCVFKPPCVSYTLKSMGLNATTIAGRKVILATDIQKSVTGLPLTINETTNFVDDSSPAPLPSGASAADISPSMLDVAPPVVIAVPPVAAFVTATMLPATFIVTFTLTAPFPLAWDLRVLVTTPPGASMDATNGLPSGLVVAPAGGEWSSPSLTITCTMTAAFMASLGPGAHKLFMTGVTQRGASAYAEATVTVT